MKALIALTVAVLVLALQASAQVIIDGDPVEPQNTATLINKTLDAEGTGNVLITVPNVEFSAATCQDTAASTGFNLAAANVPTETCVSGTNVRGASLSFPDASETFVQASFWLPDDLQGSIVVDYQLIWKGTAITGNVDWLFSTICVADGETMDPAFNTRQEVTDAGKGTANQLNTFESTGITMTGCAANEILFLRLGRDGDDATNDTYAAAAEVLKFRFKIRRAQ